MTLPLTALRRGLSKVVAAAVVVSAFCGSAQAASTATVAFSPPVKNVIVGESFTMDLSASAVSNGIGGWDFLIGFATAGIASLDSVTFSNALGDESLGEALTFSGPDYGVVSLLSTADLLALQSTQPFTLATLAFTALSVGSTTVDLSTPSGGVLLVDADGFEIGNPNVGYGLINVSVPEPSAVVLMLMGLGLVGGVALRGRRSLR